MPHQFKVHWLHTLLIGFSIMVAVQSGTIFQANYEEAMKIVEGMTLDQKIGQTIQVDFQAITDKREGTDARKAQKLHLGSLLVGGDGVPNDKGDITEIPDEERRAKGVYLNGTMENWKKLTSKFNYQIQVKSKDGKLYNIGALLASDSVHNNQKVLGTILFPHNIGLSCSHNADNFYNMGFWTANNVKESGFQYSFAPTVAVSHNPQWGRYFESMGQNPESIRNYAKSFVDGLQKIDNSKIKGVLGTAKHFFGDGATLHGADQGSASVGIYKGFYVQNIQGYAGASEANVGSVMCSYSGINWIPMSIGPWMQTFLRMNVAFDGFIISDYDQLQRVKDHHLPTSFQKMAELSDAVTMTMNAGIDMFMLPGYRGHSYIVEVIDAIKQAVEEKDIPMERLNSAVARILSVKMAMDLVKPVNQRKTPTQKFVNKVKNLFKKEQEANEETEEVIIPKRTGQTTEYEDSLSAVHESLVLLKNANVLPIKTSFLEYIVLVGERVININQLSTYELFKSYDNIGMQCGGWSMRWQGFEGNIMWQGANKEKSNASSILDALTNLKQNFTLVHPNYTTVTEIARIEI